jgi:hypothetical protein
MTLIVVLNIAFAAIVLVGIVSLLSRSILTPRPDGAAPTGRGHRAPLRAHTGRGRRAAASMPSAMA